MTTEEREAVLDYMATQALIRGGHEFPRETTRMRTARLKELAGISTEHLNARVSLLNPERRRWDQGPVTEVPYVEDVDHEHATDRGSTIGVREDIDPSPDRPSREWRYRPDLLTDDQIRQFRQYAANVAERNAPRAPMQVTVEGQRVEVREMSFVNTPANDPTAGGLPVPPEFTTQIIWDEAHNLYGDILPAPDSETGEGPTGDVEREAEDG